MIKATKKGYWREKKVVYSFSVENEIFEAHYCYGQGGRALALLHNGTPIGDIIQKPREKSQYRVDAGGKTLTITAWFEGGVTKGGPGIEIDGRPVQYTLAAPYTQHIKDLRIGLILLAILFGIRMGLIVRKADTTNTEIIMATVYFFSMLSTLFLADWYLLRAPFTIIAGLAFSILELIGPIAGLIPVFLAGMIPVPSPISILLIALRFGALFYIVKSFKWLYTNPERDW